MMQESSSQHKQRLRPDFRWGIILGLLLGILFALVFYFGWGSSTPTPNVVTEQDNLLLEYGLLILLLFFVVGILRGRVTGSEHSGVLTSISACLIQALTAVLLNGVLSAVVSTSFRYFAGYADNPKGAGILWGLFAAGVIFLIGLVGVTGAALGGLIGSRFLRRRLRSD